MEGGEIDPTATSGSIDAKRRVEGGEMDPTATSGSMDAKRGMEAEINATTNSLCVSCKKAKTGMEEASISILHVLRTTGNSGPRRGIAVKRKPLRYDCVCIIMGEWRILCTNNMVPDEDDYDGKIMRFLDILDRKVEYREFSIHHSKLAAAVFLEVDKIWIKRGVHVLYLGASSADDVCHVSNIVGPNGFVYAVVVSPLGNAEDMMVNMAAKRDNVTLIFEDARHPTRYADTVVQKVDVIYCDFTDHDQVAILVQNAANYLREGGHFVMSVQIDDDDKMDLCFKQIEEELKAAAEFMLLETTVLYPMMKNYGLVFGDYKMPRQ